MSEPEMTLRVLLFSPVRDRDPTPGDIAYTEALLADPPPGVHYTTYPEALEAGLIRVRGRRAHHGNFTPTDAALLAVRSGELLLRKAGAMYREPSWFVTVEPSAFDVVHQHLFSMKQVGNRVPVVTSAGYPLPVLYATREQWSTRRLQVATGLESIFTRSLRIDNPWLNVGDRGLMTVYTEHFRRYLIGRGVDPGKVSVCSTALPDVPTPERRSDGRTVGFIGRDFELKGGDIALDAFTQIRKTSPDVRLRLITSSESAAKHTLGGPGVEVLTEVPRSAILEDHLPEIDLLLLPTRADCGAPLVLLEALRSGVCAIASRLPWLDERLTPPAVVRVDTDARAVATAMALLLEPETLRAAQASARALWAEHFSTAVLNHGLLEAYRFVAGRDQ